MSGVNQADPRSAPDPLAAPTAAPLRSAPLRARMPPAARRVSYIYAPGARGGAGHLNERPIKGRRRTQAAGPTCTVGDAGGLVPQPTRLPGAGGVQGGKKGGGFLRELGREGAPRGKRRELSSPPLTAHLSGWTP